MGAPLEGQAAAVGADLTAGAAAADVDLEGDIDEEDDEAGSPDVPTLSSASSPAPVLPEPAYISDPFESPPSPEVSTPVPLASNEASPSAPEPVAPALADPAGPPEPHEPSDSGR